MFIIGGFMQIFATYIIMFLVFVIIEALMLTFFMGPFFSKHIGHLNFGAHSHNRRDNSSLESLLNDNCEVWR